MGSFTSFGVTLYLDGVSPAPAWMMESLESVQVNQSDQAPNGFQITFTMVKTVAQTTDYSLVSSEQLRAGCRIAIAAIVAGIPTMLVDGYITHQQFEPGTPQDEARFIVTGEDVSVQMDMYEYSLEYPLMPDFAIAGLVLAKWLVLGIVPQVHPTPTSGFTFEQVPQQAGTDRAYLQKLAADHGYVFFIKAGPVVGANTAYWGPPPRDDIPQRTLTVDSGSDTNVSEINFCFDARAPQYVWGAVLNTNLDIVVPISTLTSTRTGTLATRPALSADLPFVRTTLFDHQGLGVVTALAKAQAITNISTDQVVAAEGKLDALRYGTVLTAPGVVGVRGAGSTYDGLYYVQKTTHRISRGGYEQDFTLTREGVGTTVANLGAGT